MARPRKPTHLHIVAKTAKPCRLLDREGEPQPEGGDLRDIPPPRGLTREQRRIWIELRGHLHPGVAFVHDMMAFELLVRMVADMRAGDTKPALMAQIRAALGAFGLTPSDRSRVAGPKPKPKTGFAALRGV